MNAVEAVKAFSQAIQIYNDSGRFSQTAKLHKEMAEIFEQDNNVSEALSSYQKVMRTHLYVFILLHSKRTVFT